MLDANTQRTRDAGRRTTKDGLRTKARERRTGAYKELTIALALGIGAKVCNGIGDMMMATSDYRRAYERSLARPGRASGRRPPKRFPGRGAGTASSTTSRAPFVHWFPGGMLNTCYNAVDRHVERGTRQAARDHLRQPGHRRRQDHHLRELRDEVARLAGSLRALGLEKGDRVIIYMPGVPEAIFAMLACARLGAIHSVVFGGFASKELATRIDDAKPKIILSASCGIEAGARHPVQTAPRQGDRDGDAQAGALPGAAAAAEPGDAGRRVAISIGTMRSTRGEPADCVPVAATDPLYIHYTSGTTGIPKGVVRDNGGHAVALKWSMTNVFSAGPGEVFWAGVRHRLDRRPRLHRLRTAAARRDDDSLRGKAGRHARRRRVLAGVRAARRQRAVHGADGVSGDQARGSRRTFHAGARSVALPPAVPRGRTLRSRHACSGPASGWAFRSSITGGRPSWAGRRLPTAPASASCRSNPGRRRCPFRATTSAC